MEDRGRNLANSGNFIQNYRERNRTFRLGSELIWT